MLYFRKEAAASKISKDILDEISFSEAKVLHITGIFPALSETTIETIFKAIEKAHEQGICNAVGMAMAEAHLADKFNKENYSVVNHYTYAICGDGCLMEGISGEASSQLTQKKQQQLGIML